MKMNRFFLLLFFNLSLFLPGTIFPQNNGLKGTWQGTLSLPGVSFRIVFHITQGDNGSYLSTMDSPDQGAKDIPVDKTTLTGNQLKLEMPNLKGEYNGTINDTGDTIQGTWTQGGQSFPLNLLKSDKPVVINRPQEPKPPYPYHVEEVTYINTTNGNTLAGTFTRPPAEGTYPTVILITGSGAQNRDEELLGHKPFLVLADYLTRQGIAVLRVDDRGVGKSTGDFSTATTADFATDVLAGIAYLKTRTDVNLKKIGLIGHSEGGLIAPLVAVHSPDVAFIILMAGPGLPGDQILLLQSALIQKANGIKPADIHEDEVLSKKFYKILKTEPDPAKSHRKILEIIDNYYNSLSAEEQKKIGEKDAIIQKIGAIETPWFKYFLTYDPRPTLEKVTCPVLAINGSKDLQVPSREDLQAIAKALGKGGNKQFKTMELKGLNHLFQKCKTGNPSEYNIIEETISPTALKIIGEWITHITK